MSDVLVLTKPLGTQVAVNAHQWLDIPGNLKNYLSRQIKSKTKPNQIKSLFYLKTIKGKLLCFH